MRLLTWISRLFQTAPSAPEPVSQPAPADPEAEAAVLADAHRKDTLRRMRAAIFHDANRNEFGVRLPDGRILYRPTHSEALALWYGEDARQRPGMTTVPGQTAEEEKAQQPRRKMRRPVEAVDPESGEVRHRFNCAADAERAGFRLDCIHAAHRGKVKTHAGWLWRYAGDPVPPQPLPQPPAQIHPLPQLQSEGAPSNDPVRASERTGRRHGARSVEALDPETGEVRHRFDRIADAARAGFTRECIHAVLRGRGRTHAGLLWRYSSTHRLGLQPPSQQRPPKERPPDVQFVERVTFSNLSSTVPVAELWHSFKKQFPHWPRHHFDAHLLTAGFKISRSNDGQLVLIDRAYRPITVKKTPGRYHGRALLASHEYRGQAEASYPMIVDAARQCKLDYRKLYQAINKDKTVGGYYWRWAALGNETSVEKVMPC